MNNLYSIVDELSTALEAYEAIAVLYRTRSTLAFEQQREIEANLVRVRTEIVAVGRRMPELLPFVLLSDAAERHAKELDAAGAPWGDGPGNKTGRGSAYKAMDAAFVAISAVAHHVVRMYQPTPRKEAVVTVPHWTRARVEALPPSEGTDAALGLLSRAEAAEAETQRVLGIAKALLRAAGASQLAFEGLEVDGDEECAVPWTDDAIKLALEHAGLKQHWIDIRN